jgi:K+-transporting ATPase KdpF subunit
MPPGMLRRKRKITVAYMDSLFLHGLSRRADGLSLFSDHAGVRCRRPMHPGYLSRRKARNSYRIFISFLCAPSRTPMRSRRILASERSQKIVSKPESIRKVPSLRDGALVLSGLALTTGVQINVGRHSTRHSSRLLRSLPCLYPRLRQALKGETPMILDYVLSGAVTVFLTVYLTYALIRPERF